MKFTTSALTILTTLLPLTALARINLGIATYASDNHQDHAIWIDGADPCEYTYLGPNGGNVCNAGSFTMSNGFTYRLTGCGVQGESFCLLNADSSLNSCGTFEQKGLPDVCSNGQGQYSMQQTWHFE